MILSKYTDNLYQSEVYRELERQAVKKGFFNLTEEELVKLAAQEVQKNKKINEQADTSLSDDLVQDIARLAFAMRRKGFITQAEDIENNLVIYKQAENAFYDVTKETNKDFIDFAHRDGDVNLIEGSGDLGAFETMQSISDKILAVIRKEPTGDQPMNRMAELATMINKIGQVSKDIPKTKKAILDQVQNTLEEFDAARKGTPSLDNLYFSDLSNEAQQSAYVYFARLAGVQVNPQAIQGWYRVSGVAQKEGVLTEGNVPIVTPEALYTKLQNAQSLIPTAQTETLRKIANAIGMLPAFDSTFLNKNNESTYIFAGGFQIATNNDNAWKACRWLAQQVFAVYVAAFGNNNETITKAQEVARSIPQKLYNMLNTIKFEKVSDTPSALRQLVKVSRDIGDCFVTFTKQPTFGHMKEINSNLIDQIVSWVRTMISDVSSQYKAMASSDQLQTFSMDTSALDAAYNYWNSLSQSEDADTAKKGMSIASRIESLKDVISEYTDKPWIELQQALFDMGIDAPNKNVFLASVRRIAESAKGRK